MPCLYPTEVNIFPGPVEAVLIEESDEKTSLNMAPIAVYGRAAMLWHLAGTVHKSASFGCE